ncbi:MAG: hypothetical protein LBB48_05290, partial [Treponema sp.]|nr:hypothetical protein [Treponema sp.]
DKTLKTPYQRLTESSPAEEGRAGPAAQRALLNPVELRIPLTRPSTSSWLSTRLKLPFQNVLPKPFGYFLKCLITGREARFADDR